MFKKNKIISVFVFVSVLLVLFSSCKDNPVTTKKDSSYQFDTARFNWHVDTINHNIGDEGSIWAEDTNNIFYSFGNGFIYYDGRNYQVHYFVSDFLEGPIDGLDKNNVYFGGMFYNQQYLHKPRIQKWNGSSLEEIVIPDSLGNKYPIHAMKVKSASEIWWGTDSGRIVRFDGINNFTTYSIDSNFRIMRFLKDENNNFFLNAIRWPNNNNGNISLDDIYKFDGISWQKICSKSYQDKYVIEPYQIGNQILGCDMKKIYKFINNDYSVAIEFPSNMALYTNDIGGFSNNDLMTEGVKLPQNQNQFIITAFHWNGSKWSLEIEGPESAEASTTIKINNKYFCFFWSSYGIVYIYKGTPKR